MSYFKQLSTLMLSNAAPPQYALRTPVSKEYKTGEGQHFYNFSEGRQQQIKRHPVVDNVINGGILLQPYI